MDIDDEDVKPKSAFVDDEAGLGDDDDDLEARGAVVVLDQLSIKFQIDRYVTVQENHKIMVHHWWCLHQHQHRVHHRTQLVMPVRKRGHSLFCDVINAVCKCSSGWLLISARTALERYRRGLISSGIDNTGVIDALLKFQLD